MKVEGFPSFVMIFALRGGHTGIRLAIYMDSYPVKNRVRPPTLIELKF